MTFYLEKFNSDANCADLGTPFKICENSSMHQIVHDSIIGMTLGSALKC